MFSRHVHVFGYYQGLDKHTHYIRSAVTLLAAHHLLGSVQGTDWQVYRTVQDHLPLHVQPCQFRFSFRALCRSYKQARSTIIHMCAFSVVTPNLYKGLHVKILKASKLLSFWMISSPEQPCLSIKVIEIYQNNSGLKIFLSLSSCWWLVLKYVGKISW